MSRTITTCAFLAALALAVCGCGTNPQYSAELNIPEKQPVGDGIFDIDGNADSALGGGFARAYYERGLEYAQKGDHHRAIIEFEHALDIDPRYADACYARAVSCEAVGETEVALEAYRAFLDCADPLDPRIETAKTKIAELEKEQGADN